MKAINADNDNDGNDDDNDNDGSDDDSGNHDDNDNDDDIIITTMMATMPITTIMVVCPSYNQAGWQGATWLLSIAEMQTVGANTNAAWGYWSKGWPCLIE